MNSLVGIIFLVLLTIFVIWVLYNSVKTRLNYCIWWFDDLDDCWRTQCIGDASFVYYSKEERWKIEKKLCPFCKKPIKVTQFIEGSEDAS